MKTPRPDGKFEVKLKIGGVEVSFRAAVEALVEQFDRNVQEAAVALVMKQAGGLESKLQGMLDIVQSVEREMKDECRRVFPETFSDRD